MTPLWVNLCPRRHWVPHLAVLRMGEVMPRRPFHEYMP
jgi:hypothetical protein